MNLDQRIDEMWHDAQRHRNIVLNYPYEKTFYITSGYENGKTYHVLVEQDGTITFKETTFPEEEDELTFLTGSKRPNNLFLAQKMLDEEE